MAGQIPDMGFRKNYKVTGKPGYAGGPGQAVEKGPSGSKQANNAKIALAQVPAVNSKGLYDAKKK
jgi:hypothetical protein